MTSTAAAWIIATSVATIWAIFNQLDWLKNNVTKILSAFLQAWSRAKSTRAISAARMANVCLWLSES